jgi:hypothetical protein
VTEGVAVKTLMVQGIVTEDGMLRLEVPCDLPPGPVEVEVTIRPAVKPSGQCEPKWAELYGLGAEIWRGVDVEEYLRELREDREIRR